MKRFLGVKGGQKKKKLAKAVLAGLCVCTVTMTSVSPVLPTGIAYASVDTRLDNLVIDKVYELQPTGGDIEDGGANSSGFSPDITEYEGTAYSSVDEVKVYPFAASPAATVTVNGNRLNNGYASVRTEEPGEYPITVNVSNGGQETSYRVVVMKVDSDYRGRRAIVKNEAIMEKLSVETDAGDPAKLMEILKKDYLVTLPETGAANQYVNTDESYWETYLPPANESDSTPAASFTVDLGDVYSVSRIRALVGPANLGLGGNKVRISVSTDGINWEIPITKGNLNTGTQWHQNVIRYEFGVSHQARYIKYEITNWQNKDKNLRLYQFMIYYDAGTVPEEQPAPEGGSVPYQHEDRHRYLASGQATVIERGLPLSGWTPSGGYGRGIPTRAEAEQFGYDGPLFYDPDFQNKDYMLYNPDALWGIAKAPFGGNTMEDAGEPRDFIPESMKPYISNAVSLCFGDEGVYSTEEAKIFGEWFQWTKERYPGTIVHSNQAGNQWQEVQLREYMRIAKPDMLSWDNYYGDTSIGGHNLSVDYIQRSAARRLMTLSNWEIYRKLAYEGLDGSGSQPIIFGQYLDTFETNLAESGKNLETNLSIVSGAKWLNFFRLEYQFDRCYLWDEDGTPTRGLLEWKQIIDRIHAMDDQTNRLNNDWMMFKIGSIGNDRVSPDGFRRGDFDRKESKAKNAEFGIEDMSVRSLSNTFGGGTGDVILGYFNTVPGLYENEIAEYFNGATAPKAFMVLNGLIAGKSESYKRINIPERDKGSSANTRQEITIKTTPELADKTLYCVDKDDRDGDGNGIIKEVARDAAGNFTVILGGGEANLYFWGLDTKAAANSQSEGAYASFAFDGHPATYWEPSSAAEDSSYQIGKTFAPVRVDHVTVAEKGNAVRGYLVEYLTEDGSWLPFGPAGDTVGPAKQVTISKPVNAYGIRLKITAADGVPAIYEIGYGNTKEDPGQVHEITVNDNTMGTGLNRFQYDDMWSYRENERNGNVDYYPLENDGHFSNYTGAEARFQFYGTKVELLLRESQASQLKARVVDQNDQTVGVEKTGNGRSLIFDNLDQNIYTLVITKISDSQAGIDGVTVTYQGALPEAVPDEKAEQVYLNQRVTNHQTSNYFTYGPHWSTVDMGANDFGEYASEDSKWVEHVQNTSDNNCGFTRTKLPGAEYTIHFYGTGVQLYTSVLPVHGNTSFSYGDLEFELDGKPVPVEYHNVTSEDSSMKKNAKISVRVAEIQVPNATENGDHTLKVTVNSGYNRIDYAVVNRYAEENYRVTLKFGENGTAELVSGPEAAGGMAVVKISPAQGYQIHDILINGKLATVPEDGMLVIKNITENTVVNISFRKARYRISLMGSMQGGSVIPDTFFAEAGTRVTLRPEAFVGYTYKPDSITAHDESGNRLVLQPADGGAYQVTMPESGITVTAEFEAVPYLIVTETTENGKIVSNPAAEAIYGRMVTVTVQPDNGYRLKKDSLKAVLEKGGSLALNETENPLERTFLMPAQNVTLHAVFEKIPEYTVTVDETVMNGSVKLDKKEVAEGESVTVSFMPDSGFMLGTLQINGDPWFVTRGDLILNHIDSDITIKPSFVSDSLKLHTGTVVTGDESQGTAEPSEQLILDNGNAVVLAHPNPGYHSKSVTVEITKTLETASGSNAAEAETASGSNAAKSRAASGSNAVNPSAAGGSITKEQATTITREYPFPEGKNKVVIPDITADAVIRVHFDRTLYPVTVKKADNGTVTAIPEKAGYGQTVTLSVTGDKGYRLKGDSLKAVTDANEYQNLNVVEEGKTYTFNMPASRVTVLAQFEADPNPPAEPEEPKPPVKPEEPKPPVKPEEPKPPVKPEKPQKPNTSSNNSGFKTKGVTGWGSDRNGWRYLKGGRFVISSWEYTDWMGKWDWYYFGADGYMVTGWLKDTDGRWYYLNPVSDGAMGSMTLGLKQIDGTWYYFNEVSDGTKGAMLEL